MLNTKKGQDNAVFDGMSQTLMTDVLDMWAEALAPQIQWRANKSVTDVENCTTTTTNKLQVTNWKQWQSDNEYLRDIIRATNEAWPSSPI